jgi:hypothetical protein
VQSQKNMMEVTIIKGFLKSSWKLDEEICEELSNPAALTLN